MTSTVTSYDDWRAARLDLLAREKAHMRAADDLARARRALPRLRIDKDYVFTGPDGPVTLAELFGGKSQLVIYHFMFGADWAEGCPSCSFWADNLDGIDIHLAHRDVAFRMVSTAPLETIEAYQRRMGWRFLWVSAAGSDFNRDMGVSFTAEDLAAGTQVYNFKPGGFGGPEAPGLTVFSRDADGIFLTYATYARGLEAFNGAYQLLDLVPKGRDEGDLDFTQAWLRRRDQYDN